MKHAPPKLGTRPNPWQQKSNTRIYENPWFSIEEDDVINPGGGLSHYGKILFKNIAIGIVPLDENSNTWLVGQYRYALDRYSWEIPEGGCPLGTEPLEAGRRELREETGLPVSIADDPLTCVARGGGRALELIDERGGDFFSLE